MTIITRIERYQEKLYYYQQTGISQKKSGEEKS